MKSDRIKEGIERAPHRALLNACGITHEKLKRPFIAVVNSWTEIVSGHIHLQELAKSVKEGIKGAGGVPFEFHTIAVCDGLAMRYKGMKYSLPSLDVIANSIETIIEDEARELLMTLKENYKDSFIKLR